MLAIVPSHLYAGILSKNVTSALAQFEPQQILKFL